MTWRILSRTRTLGLPSWWLKPARSPASRIGLHLLPSTLFPFQVYIPNGSETGRVAKLTLWTGAKGCSVGATDTLYPSWAARISKLGGRERREDTTLPTHRWGGIDLPCFLRYVYHVPPLPPNMRFKLSLAQLRWATSRHTAVAVQQKGERVASHYC